MGKLTQYFAMVLHHATFVQKRQKRQFQTFLSPLTAYSLLLSLSQHVKGAIQC